MDRERKPNGYWTKETVLAECKQLIAERGEEALRKRWLDENGYSSLCYALKRRGGLSAVRQELGLKAHHIPPKSTGPWSKKHCLDECRRIVDQYGAEALSYSWLANNNRLDVAARIKKYGGFFAVKEELGIKANYKPKGYWTKENMLAECKEIIAKYGENEFTYAWLEERGYTDVICAIYKNGGFVTVRNELGLEAKPRKPGGYWTKENILNECSRVVAKYGEDALTRRWLESNGHSALRGAISKHLSFPEIRKLIGIKAPQTKAQQQANQRRINHTRIKELLQGLRGHVHALSPREIYVLLQQHNLDNLPKEEGGLLVERLTGGGLPNELIADWLDSDQPEPAEAPTATKAKKQSTSEATGEAASGGDAQHPGAAIEAQDNEPADLPTIKSVDALELLTSHAWAADDQEAAEALICSCLDKVWNHAYADEQEALEQVTTFKGNAWSDELRSRFLSVYNRAKGLELPDHYRFPHQPRLMQRVVAAEAAERRRLLVLSGMGLGKTLASMLATQAAGSQLTWVICPNNAIGQWTNAIAEQWAGVEVRSKQLNPQWKTDGPRVLLLNFERFSHLKDEQIAELMADSAPDAFIIDEVQFAKQRTTDFQSTRRQQLAKCIQVAGEQNDRLMVLGMSGTPILNNLMEGQKLIELVFAEERRDLGTESNLHNAMRMFQEFTRLGIRQRGNDIWPSEVVTHPVDAGHLLDDLREVRARNKGSMSAYEQALLQAKLPTIKRICAQGPTVVVTEFVEGIVGPIREMLLQEGHRVGVFTGQNKEATYGPFANALEEFKAGATDVLIGSGDCMGTGIDGLQYRCHRMVFATLPWTDGDFSQITARLARHGQQHEVEIHIPQTSLSYRTRDGLLEEWSFCQWRWAVIDSKRVLAAAAVDGINPGSDDRLTPQKAVRYIEGWLERLGNDTVIQRYGRPIRVPLVFTSETAEVNARRHYGDFSNCNSRWNKAHSSKTHQRLNGDPQEWELYHTDLAATRKEWLLDPLQEVINKCRTLKGMVIGDFGCGTAELADALRGRNKVHSFDHIAINDDVTACDIGNGVPLEDESLDVAVFSLSLMGSNWQDYLIEANRCLKPTGQIIIWQPKNQSHTKEIDGALEQAGFRTIETVERWKWVHYWAVKNQAVMATEEAQAA